MKKIFLIFCLIAIGIIAKAQNPIIGYQFDGQPSAKVFGDRLYIYAACQSKNDSKQDICVFSTDNLVDFTNHGSILSSKSIFWAEKDSPLSCPSCVKVGDNYIVAFSCLKRESKTNSIGIASSDSPVDGFRPFFFEYCQGSNPNAFVDQDGTPYLYYSNDSKILVRKLKNNLRGEAELFEVKMPEDFSNYPFLFQKDNNYYLTYQTKQNTIAYAMSNSPLGPWEYKGLILDQKVANTNIKSSVVEFKNQYYLFYDANDYDNKLNNLRADSLFFANDGTIKKVSCTNRGVGISQAINHIHLDRFSNKSSAVKIDFLDSKNPFDGFKTIFTLKNDFVLYNRVEFQNNPKSISICYQSSKGSVVDVFANQTLIKTIKLAPSKDFRIATVDISSNLKGIKDLKIVHKDNNELAIDYMNFDMSPWTLGAMTTHKYRNLFVEFGYNAKEVDNRLNQIFNNLFFGKDKVYFEVNDSMAYVSDIKNNDVRTEGMSYGMMAAVQFNRKDIFDKLFTWAKYHMQNQDGNRKGYFAWSCKIDGTKNSESPASDGELYYVTSLIFASNRWGNDGKFDYLKEAQHIIDCSFLKVGMNDVSPFINVDEKLITFTPDPYGGKFTDPSYNIPVFYEIWAKYLNDNRSNFWLECAKTSRAFLHKAINPNTGLNPDYCNYDGSLLNSRQVIGDCFRFDSWRVPMNIAMDYTWACADKEFQQNYANTIQKFLYNQGVKTFVDQYNVDGTTPEQILDAGGKKQLRHSLGFVATAASVSLCATNSICKEFVAHFWESENKPYSDGYFDAYFDGFMQLFAFMHLSGNYRIIEK